MVTYFTTWSNRLVLQGDQTQILKVKGKGSFYIAMRRGQQFADNGHVQNVCNTLYYEYYLIRAEVLPSMRNDPP